MKHSTISFLFVSLVLFVTPALMSATKVGEAAPDVTGTANDYLTKMQAAPTAALLDPSGNIGRLYDAKTSPHMFVINPQGVLIYDGAIDDKPTPDLNDVAGAKNYVSAALEQAMAGKTVEVAATRPYGCSVKYSDSAH